MGNTQAKKLLSKLRRKKEKKPVPAEPVDPEYRFVNGRRFGRKKQYVMPVDQKEVERLGILHLLNKCLFQGNFSSPIKGALESGIKVLDIGCGAGSWILDMADSFPSSSFIGIDISPFFPSESLPPNVEFIQANVLDGIPMNDSEIDLIIIHYLCGVLTHKQWEFVLKEIARTLKDGGILEWTEPDMRVENMGPSTNILMNSTLALVSTKGQSPFIIGDIPRYIAHCDTLRITSYERHKLPYGKWGGELGQMGLTMALEVFQTLKKFIMEFMSLTPAEYDRLLEEYTRELDEKHTYHDYYRFIIRKEIKD